MPRNQWVSQRGIFGVLRPAEPTLFSFLPNGGMQDWPSDDDDDDYDPDDLGDSDDDGERQTAGPAGASSKLKKTSSKLQRKTVKKSTKTSQAASLCNTERNKRQSTTVPKTKGKRRQHKKPTLAKGDDDNLAAGTDEGTGTSEEAGSEGQGSVAEGHHLWGQRLPMVALQSVFQYAVSAEGAVPFLCRACRVCRLWREAAIHSSLWQHVDLANGRVKCTDATLDWLAQNRLAQLRSINLGGWAKLTDAGINALVKHCPQQVAAVHLAGCIKLTAESVGALADNCPNLHTLDLSNTNADVASISSMTRALQTVGTRLNLLNLAGNKLKGATIILKSLMTHCGNLRTLDISNCKFSSDFLMLHIEELQLGCPRLEVLLLAGCMVRASQATNKVQVASTGFPELKELSLAVNLNCTNGAIDDGMLLRILVKSHRLRLLDLRGCTHITALGIQRLPVYDLRHLFISQCSVSRYEGIEAIVQKWRHSLAELDLSWNVFPAMSLDIAMKKLSSVPPGQSVLRDINLAGTSITAERVRSILEGCPTLVSLNLASCRGLPRGMKRSYHGNCLTQLKADLKAAPPSTLEYIE